MGDDETDSEEKPAQDVIQMRRKKRKRPDSVRVTGRSSNSPPPKSAHNHSTM
jgi:hypothetical protein